MQRVTLALFTAILTLGLLSLPVINALGASETNPSFPDTVPLPQTATIGTQFVHKHFRVDPATSKDLGGVSTRGIAAWTITVLDGVGGSGGPISLPPPKFVLNSPAEVRDKVALFQTESRLQGGWTAVPRGWQVLSADAGVQGGWGVTFVAPGGSRNGWLLIGGSGLGTTEVFSASEGYFRGAYHLENEVIPNTLDSDAKLSPTPSYLAHPNACTALVSYKSSGLIVKGIRQFGGDGILGFSIALPASKAALQDFLLAAFRKKHPVLSCPKNIKDW